MVTREKCNFCTYFVTGAPNGPPIQADGKSAISAPTVSVVLQMVPHTCWLARSAISVPTLSVVLQMVPLYNLYWLTEEKCNFCTYFLTGALWLLRLTFWPHYNWSTKWSPIKADCWNCHINYWPKFTILPLNGPLYSLIVEIASVWPHFTTGPPKGPPYRLIVEMFTFWPHFVNGPHSGWLLKSFWS